MERAFWIYSHLPVEKTRIGRNVCAAESDGDIFPVMILCLGGYGGSSSLITPSGFSI